MDVKICNTSDSWEDMQPEVGQVFCFVNDKTGNKELKMWSGTSWDPIRVDANSEVKMTAYDINKQVISQLSDLINEEIENGKNKIRICAETQNNTFYMLLCRDLNYYTVLMHDPENAAPNDTIENVVIECAQSLGVIKSIEQIEAGVIEIWVTNKEDTYVMYFFGYDKGVEKCR